MSWPESGGVDAVIFDIGNVLLKFDYEVAARRLMVMNGLAELPERAPIVAAKVALEGGEIDRAEFLRRVKPAFRHAGSDEDFLGAWREIFEENLAMTALARELAGRGVPTFLLSNISCIHAEFIAERYPVFSTFRDAVFSYRAGVLKPEERVYRVAIEQFGVAPERTVFVDDLVENVAAAEAVGLRGVVYDWRNHAAAERELAALGLPIPA